MNRRTVLTGLGGTAVLLAGCLGNERETGAGDGDVGTQPPATLRMTPATDADIARRVTYRIGLDHRESEREIAAAAVEDGTATVSGTGTPFPANTPFVHEDAVYELSSEVVESTPGVRYRLAFDAVSEDVPDERTVRYDDLPAIDRAALARYGWSNPDSFAVEDVPVTYPEDEIPESELVPKPEHPVVVWDAGTRGRVTVERTGDVDVKTYQYTAHRVHASAEKYGQQVRAEHAFVLADLPDAQAAIVSEAITDDGYAAPRGKPVPAAFERLVQRFAEQTEVHRVTRESDSDSSVSGNYVLDYEGTVYWAELFVRDDAGTADP